MLMKKISNTKDFAAGSTYLGVSFFDNSKAQIWIVINTYFSHGEKVDDFQDSSSYFAAICQFGFT